MKMEGAWVERKAVLDRVDEILKMRGEKLSEKFKQWKAITEVVNACFMVAKTICKNMWGMRSTEMS